MDEDEDECEANYRRDRGSRCDTPCEASQELEGREEVRERWVCKVIRVLCFCRKRSARGFLGIGLELSARDGVRFCSACQSDRYEG